MSNQYEIFLRDENKKIIGQLDGFSSLVFIRRFNAVGSWALKSSTSALALLTKKGGIVVHRNGDPFFSGDMSEFEDENGIDMTANGDDDLGPLAGRLVLPVSSGAPFVNDYDVRSAAAETAIKQYVNLNAGPGALADRRVHGLSIEVDKGLGINVTGRARFDNLLVFINSLAIQAGLGFRVNNSEFQIYKPSDKTKSIIFSTELGTLGAYKFHEKRGKVNYIYCGGTGTGSSRVFYEKQNSDAILSWGRFEAFIDKNNTSVAAELAAAASEELERQCNQVSLTFTPVVTETMRPIDDYDIGDWVTAVVRGQTINQRVMEMKTSIDVSGAEVHEMTIGTEGQTTDLSGLSAIYSRIRGLDQRLSTQERR